MKPVALLTALGVSFALPVAGPAAAQTAPARGTTIWVRSGGGSITELVGSALAAPQLAVGVRGDRLTLGVGLGLIRATTTDKNDFGGGDSSKETLRATLLQLGPEFLYDIWSAPDSRTRGNLAGGASLGRVSLVDEVVDVFGGQTTRSETRTSGTLLTLRLGVGGEHFFDRHFALGVEAGVRGTFTLGLKESGQAGNSQAASAAGTYVALRGRVVFGR